MDLIREELELQSPACSGLGAVSVAWTSARGPVKDDRKGSPGQPLPPFITPDDMHTCCSPGSPPYL